MEELTAKQELASAFDAHHAPSNEIIEKCVHCGFCLPVCPTYVLWGQEMDSPRGRIYLMKMASEGTAEMNAKWVSHFDSCLGCMACMTACPSGVDYGKLIEATRAQIERKTERSRGEKLHRRFVFETFTRPERLRQMRWPLLAYQKSGLQAVVRGSGLLKLLPKRARAMEALLPKLGPREMVAEVTPAVGTKRRRAGLLLGCVQREFFPQVNAATVRVLAAEGCEVVAPREQPCCGALLVHAGEETAAVEFAKKAIEAFERANVETIVTNAAGCGSNVKEYGHLLRDEPEYAERAKVFAAKCKDITEILAELEPRAKRNTLKLRVAFHDSCHLQHAQGVRTQPRALLSSIPGLEIAEIPEAAICCGSAGIYNLVQPDAANALGDRKANLIAPLKTDVVATGNPGCVLQLQASLARCGCETPVVHTIQLLDASIRGESSESLRR
ncbi:MAG: glycolate oxidase [Acidobacteria bacterium 13_2_20CM_2_57_6]|nr:MAG: glycolate oxidase [Acidobacteria bacterium 13_2_20CM_57_7]OLB85005.1 MAG: glycolate oxidase [Acidobacteria bacterium 13_2_20CM_2_57_6]PYT34794.1 MAG: glycolate oxidase iron-sulfur subunit [Acidobacteriota bacterium]PYT40829.1 MAG: glycolate oxidase iron-sulfur subunit [Acidobacteriota bacterium]PYT44972.1 MAG: glycolate oxidase iron-sulfur subunit [Acidobacteriota bacterium]